MTRKRIHADQETVLVTADQPMRTGIHPAAPPQTMFCGYFLLRRWTRVLRSSLRCFFLAIRLRRFFTTEPTESGLPVEVLG